MLSNSQTTALRTAFTNIQDRIAASLRQEWNENFVLVSVSISDKSGNVLQTIEPDKKSSSRLVGFVDSRGEFANNIELRTHEKRVATMFEIASYVWSVADNRNLVVSATYQRQQAGSNVAMNHVAQAFIGKDGKFTIKQVDVEDRS